MLILVGEPSTTNRWRCCSLLLCLNNMLSYFDTLRVRNFSPSWHDPVRHLLEDRGVFIICVWGKNIDFPVITTNEVPQIAQGCSDPHRDRKAYRDIEKNVGVMSSFFIFCRCMHVFFLFIYSKTFCTSECFKERCVGEDRKSSHQLATDSVWELFASCWMFKLFAFTVNILQLLLMSQIMNILRVNTVR